MFASFEAIFKEILDQSTGKYRKASKILLDRFLTFGAIFLVRGEERKLSQIFL